MSKDKQTDVAILDFSKAFDVVPHKRLLHKLDFYGIQGSILFWISSFLSNQTQVVVDGEFSDVEPVTLGVPQGSVLGPILFLVFINDMPECVNSQCRLFADNSIIYRTVNSRYDALVLQSDFDALHKWEKDWGLTFNPTKCNTISITRKKHPIHHVYSLKGVPLKAVDEAMYLGVMVAKDLLMG